MQRKESQRGYTFESADQRSIETAMSIQIFGNAVAVLIGIGQSNGGLIIS
jgi:hypothetical protein